MIRQFKQINTNQGDLSRIQDNVTTSFNDLTSIPILDGNFITVTLNAGGADNYVEHKLGRPYVGYFVSKRGAAATIFDSPTVNTLPNQYIILRTSSAVTATLWIF